tara:strand:- start:599 stop:958 length:360 start_codon:yes stop_codon:yes gene_type:complete
MINTIKIDFAKLKSKQLNESSVAQWAADVKYLLSHILSPSLFPPLQEEENQELEKPQVVIKGSKEDLAAFSDTLNKEKEYALEYLDSGLGSPELSDIKLELEKSIHSFEKTTGVKWPLR